MRRKVPKILQGYIDRSKAELRAEIEAERQTLIATSVFITTWQLERLAVLDKMLADMGDA